MAEAMSLCISCKGCKRECPAGVDMAALKLEWLHRQNQRHGVSPRERLLADLPRQAPRLSRMASAINVAGRNATLRSLAERHFGISKHRSLPSWSKRPWHDHEIGTWEPAEGPFADTLLFVDTFTRWFEPHVARAAYDVLARTRDSIGGCFPADGRPLCCGRTYLSAGMLDEARRESERLVAYLHPYASLGVRIVGLEPSCVFTVRDEVPRLVPSAEARLVADSFSLFEEAVDADLAAGATLPFVNEPGRAAVHCHCHQKAAGAAEATVRLLDRVPGLEVSAIESGCCGMAGAFGYHAEHYDISMRMGELDLLPAVRDQDDLTVIVAPGTSCRAQILDGTGRVALHPAEVLRGAL
jgi:Fe-S oxidoreductase